MGVQQVDEAMIDSQIVRWIDGWRDECATNDVMMMVMRMRVTLDYCVTWEVLPNININIHNGWMDGRKLQVSVSASRHMIRVLLHLRVTVSLLSLSLVARSKEEESVDSVRGVS